jgi:hypothetical protein
MIETKAQKIVLGTCIALGIATMLWFAPGLYGAPPVKATEVICTRGTGGVATMIERHGTGGNEVIVETTSDARGRSVRTALQGTDDMKRPPVWSKHDQDKPGRRPGKKPEK